MLRGFIEHRVPNKGGVLHCTEKREIKRLPRHTYLGTNSFLDHPFTTANLANAGIMGIMKIIVVGSTGFVASEIIRQALSRQDVTSIYALGRREISPPPNLGPHADESKLNSVILKDFEYYPDDVKGKLAGADAVIW